MDGAEHRVSEDLFAVHDFEIKIDLDVPSGKKQTMLSECLFFFRVSN